MFLSDPRPMTRPWTSATEDPLEAAAANLDLARRNLATAQSDLIQAERSYQQAAREASRRYLRNA